MNEQDLFEVYEALEEMTPPEVRIIRQLLGNIGQIWEQLEKDRERLQSAEEDLLAVNAKLRRIKVLEGALEEIVGRVDEARGMKPKPPRPKARGVYCRNCAKMLEGRQKVFCTRRCAAVWHGQHPGEFATPRLEVNEPEFEVTVDAGEGIRDEEKVTV